MKLFELDASERGLLKKENREYGSVKLEGFVVEDKAVAAGEQRQQAIEKRAKAKFERALVQEGQLYLLEAKKRLNAEESGRETLRNSLAKIYQKMLLSHGPYMKANFRLLSYGMDEKSETFKKSFPDSFKRYFFRLVKAMTDRKGAKLSYA